MFLAFPYTEVFYVVAIVLAWLYIALGIMGSQQVVTEDVSALINTNQVQENHFQANENIKSNSRNYFWDDHSETIQAEITADPPRCYYCVPILIEYYQRPAFYNSARLDSNIPNRAPPVV